MLFFTNQHNAILDHSSMHEIKDTIVETVNNENVGFSDCFTVALLKTYLEAVFRLGFRKSRVASCWSYISGSSGPIFGHMLQACRCG